MESNEREENEGTSHEPEEVEQNQRESSQTAKRSS